MNSVVLMTYYHKPYGTTITTLTFLPSHNTHHGSLGNRPIRSSELHLYPCPPVDFVGDLWSETA